MIQPVAISDCTASLIECTYTQVSIMLCSDQMAVQIEWILNCGMGMLNTLKLTHPGFSIAPVDHYPVFPNKPQSNPTHSTHSTPSHVLQVLVSAGLASSASGASSVNG
jgi:hypothetical protein